MVIQWLSNIYQVKIDLNDYVNFFDLAISHFNSIYFEKSLNLLRILVNYPNFFGDNNKNICFFTDLYHYLTLDNLVLFAKNNLSSSSNSLSLHQQELLVYFSSLAGFKVDDISNSSKEKFDIPIETHQIHQLIINPIIFYAYGYCYSVMQRA